jgi:hypothetical protein
MNKIISLLLVTCAFTACRHSNTSYLSLIENDWKKAELKGRVKVVNNLSDNRRVIYEYNTEGFLVRNIDSNFQTEVVNSCSYKYDLSENTTYATRSEDGKPMWEDISKYDDKGNLIEVNSSGISKWIYTYDDKNRKKEKQVFGDGILSSKEIWEYKPDGSTASVELDEQKHYKKSETIDTDSSSVLSLYDTTGNKRAMWVFKKDKAGKTVYHEVWEQGKLSNYSKHFYNQYGDEVMIIAFSTNKNQTDTLTWEYTYDKMGNWKSVKSSKYGTNNREVTYW